MDGLVCSGMLMCSWFVNMVVMNVWLVVWLVFFLMIDVIVSIL